MNKKLIIGIAAVIAIAIMVLLIIQYRNKGTNQPTDSALEQSEQTNQEQNRRGFIEGDVTVEENGMKEFNIGGVDYSYDVQQLNVKKGDTVKLTFTSVKGTHDLNLDEFNAKTAILNTGESETIEFVADQAGTFEFYCSVGNHRAQGMVGTLVVTE